MQTNPLFSSQRMICITILCNAADESRASDVPASCSSVSFSCCCISESRVLGFATCVRSLYRFCLLYGDLMQVRLTSNHVQLVLQHCSGGTLEDYCRHHQVSEDAACYFFHQLVSVMEHLHASRIAYRDMKLGNVLLSSRPVPGQPPRLVLCDLGTAKHWKKGTPAVRCETFVGTPGKQCHHCAQSSAAASSTRAVTANTPSKASLHSHMCSLISCLGL